MCVCVYARVMGITQYSVLPQLLITTRVSDDGVNDVIIYKYSNR